MPSTTIKANTRLNLFDFTMIMVSFVIGMGIFRTPVNVAKASIDPAGYLFAWLAGGGIALCGALTYAEIGSRYPVTGGYFKVFSLAYHPSIAFAINGIILISNASSVAAVALVGSEYISSIIFPTAQNLVITRAAIAIFCILLFYSINLLGLKMSAKTQNALMLIKIGLVLLLILPIFFSNRSFQETMMMKHQISPGLWEYLKAFGIGLVAVSFTYGGYQQVINFGEEVKEPSKTIPRAVFLGIGIIVVLYLLVNYAYLNIIGFEQLKNAENISAIMAGSVFGDAAGKVISVLLFLSVLSYVNSALLSNPRVMQAMSEEGVLPKACGRRTVKNNVLFVSLNLFSALAILIVLWAKTFDKILSFSIFLDCFGMALSAATIFKLRKQTAGLDGTGIYKMKLFPVFPLLFISAYTFVAISIFIDQPLTAMLGLVIMGVFILIYFLRKKILSR